MANIKSKILSIAMITTLGTTFIACGGGGSS